MQFSKEMGSKRYGCEIRYVGLEIQRDVTWKTHQILSTEAMFIAESDLGEKPQETQYVGKKQVARSQ